MRPAALPTLVLGLAVLASAGATASAAGPAGSILVERARGAVQIKGSGALVGRIVRGSLQIVDLTPADQWSPRVNGVPRGQIVWLKGSNITFYVPGGGYRLVARGDGISISARGSGHLTVDGDPDATGDAGVYAVGDHAPQPLPAEQLRLPFGSTEARPAAASVKIVP